MLPDKRIVNSKVREILLENTYVILDINQFVPLVVYFLTVKNQTTNSENRHNEMYIGCWTSNQKEGAGSSRKFKLFEDGDRVRTLSCLSC